MDESDKEYIRRVFADLTGVLEDASVAAAEGQSWRITPEVSDRIIRTIERAIAKTSTHLDDIKHRPEW